tara:strand:- start:1068 stop:1256 length:189 start_codon:yes stop_codon:yes gene_type:complete
VAATVKNGLPECIADVFLAFDVTIVEGYMDVTTGKMDDLAGQEIQSGCDVQYADKLALTRQK